jgi:hypothetical protein
MNTLEQRNELAAAVMSAVEQFNTAVSAANAGGVVVHGNLNWLENEPIPKGTPHNAGVESLAVNCMVQL